MPNLDVQPVAVRGQAASTLFNMTSAALVENAWRELQRRGLAVSASRETNWKWWAPEKSTEQVMHAAERRLRMDASGAIRACT
jgi:hypothetical protein